MAEIKAAVEHIITVFRAPLESRGVCIATIQDEVEEAVKYARRYLAVGSDSYKRVGYKLHVCTNGQTCFCFASSSSVCLSLLAVLNRCSHYSKSLRRSAGTAFTLPHSVTS